MRFFRFTKYLAFTASLGLLGACDDFLDINQSPNDVLVAPPANLLVASETHLGFLMGSDLHRYTSLFVQQFSGQGGSGTQTAEFDRYSITSTDTNNAWRGSIYGGALADMQKLIDQTQAASPRYAGISKLMQAFTLSVTTDAWGDIPLTEALRFEANLRPAYDRSEDVYTSILALIDAGLEDLDKTSEFAPAAGDDLIYGGDLGKWRRFANTLKLRLYLHYYPTAIPTATSNINRLLAQGPMAFMNSNADNFQLAFAAIARNQNPIDQFEINRVNTFFPSSTLVNLMNGKDDPRRPVYFTTVPGPTPTDPRQFVGAGNGTGVVGAPRNNFSRMHIYLRGAATVTTNPTTNVVTTTYTGAAPIRMLTFAEHNFILAEHYQRTGNIVNATTSLRAGIQASMDAAGVASADATTYLTTVAGQFAAAPDADQLRIIIEEKFVANYGVAVEPWTDWRRTGFPTLQLAANAVVTQIPRILPYSDLERVANPANTPERTDLTAPSVFWDQR